MVITNSKCNYLVAISNGRNVKIIKGTYNYPENLKDELKGIVSRTSFLSEGKVTEVKVIEDPVKKIPKKRKYIKKSEPKIEDYKPESSVVDTELKIESDELND